MQLKNQEGQALTEYIILIVLIGLVAITAANKFGKTINNKIEQSAQAINGLEVTDLRSRSGERSGNFVDQLKSTGLNFLKDHFGW